MREEEPLVQDAYLEALEAKHFKLEQALLEESARPKPDTDTTQDLKRRKLQIKDELARMKGT